MSRRTLEGDVLQNKSSIMIETIAKKSDLALFGSEVCSAGFASENMVTGILGMGTLTSFELVRRIMNAATTHITTQSTPEMVTRKFNTFVLLLHDKLKLDDLARDLAQALGVYCIIIPVHDERRRRPTYVFMNNS
jgi:predicted site-specific integrase-resolvase